MKPGNENQNVTGDTIIATDITGQVKDRKKIEESEKRFSNLLMESPFAFAILKGGDMVVTLANDAIKRIWGKGTEIEGKPLLYLMPEIKEQGFASLLEEVYTTGKPFYGHEELVKLQRNGKWEDVYFNFIYQPYKEADETISGVTIIANEVTTQAIANKKIAAGEQNVRRLFMQAPAIIVVHRGPQHVYELSNEVHQQLIGNKDLLGKPVREAMPELEGTGVIELLDHVYSTGEHFSGNEVPVKVNKGAGKLEDCYFNFVYQPTHNSEGQIDGVLVHGIDVTEQVLSRKRLEESEDQQAFLLNFSDTLRAETTVDAVANRALQMLSEHLKLDRCYVGVYQLTEDRGEFPYQIGNERVPPMPASVRLSDFPDALRVAFDRTLVIDDVTKAKGLADTDKQNLGTLGLYALVAATLRRGEVNPLWSIVAVSASPRSWILSEVKLIEEVTERTWAAVERAKAEEALRQSEAKYRTIFETIDEGFVIQELLIDGAGNVTDIIYREMNAAFAQHTGIKDAKDKKASELFPHLEQHWLDNMTHVYKTGEPVRTEGYQSDMDRWFTLQYSRVGGQGSRIISAVFNDITDRKKEEEKQTYLLKLSDALKELNDPVEIQLTACKILGEHLKVSRVLYAEVMNEELLIVNNNYVNGVAPIVATIHAEQYGVNVIDAFKSNEKVIFSDINTDGRFDEDAKRNFLALNVVANFGMGLVKGGKWVATFGVHDKSPRKWTEMEILLIEETAERTWSSVERAKAEKALAESEARFRTLSDTVPQLIWTNNAVGKADYFNHRWYDYSGLSFEQSEGLGWQAIVHPDDAPASVEKWQRSLLKGVSFDTEYRLKKYDGTYAWFIGRNVPLRNDAGKIIGWFGSATNIENLKKTEEALSQSEDRLRITMESATDYAIITTNTEGKIERWSQGAADLFGYTEEEMIGQSPGVIFIEEDRNTNLLQKEMDTARRSGRAADERWLQRKDGSRFFGSGVLRPIQNSNLTGYVKVIRDNTQQQLFTEELYRQVAERTKELQRSNEDLRQFAHVTSHDLKEPVRKIQTFNSRILEEYTGELPGKVITYAQKIGTSADRMMSMIEGVLLYSKLGNYEKAFQVVNLNEMIQQVMNDLEILIGEKQATIVATGIPELKGSATLLYQLFYNLILNSLKFSKPNEPARIEIRSELISEINNPLIQITLSDNGIGFEQEFAEEIFKTFTRLHATEEYEGTGLGLALCKKIVERHGGTITATGNLNEGATFTIRLPFQQESFMSTIN